MALTPERIRELWENYSPIQGIESFARSVETEVRKDDEALIRQLVEALEGYRRNHNDGQPCDAEKAGRARLEKAP